MSSGLAPGTSAATKLARFFDKVIFLFILQHFSIFSVLFLHNKLLLPVLAVYRICPKGGGVKFCWVEEKGKVSSQKG